MSDFFLPEWSVLLQLLITTPIVYFVVIAYVRIIGVRSTSQMNSFDWIVTVGMGAITASTIILDGVTIVEGMVSIGLLLIMQMCLTVGVRKFNWLQTLLKATPQLLWYDGEYLEDNMKKARVIKAEIFAAIRGAGYKTMEDVYAVVLETNSSLSVIPNKNDDTLGFSLADVGGLPEGLRKDLEARGEGNDQPETDREDDAEADADPEPRTRREPHR